MKKLLANLSSTYSLLIANSFLRRDRLRIDELEAGYKEMISLLENLAERVRILEKANEK
ncbi:MAG: hypothetical protein HYT70_00325 [Candidatus Aenigmarchaeota archaeon]|nr:hypothetical protein [Candidatus Aenigmarchaeota archaeon]